MKRILCFVALVCLMTSCGVPKERKFSINDAIVIGTVRESVKIIPGDYTIVNDGRNTLSIPVTFELTNPSPLAQRSEYPMYRQLELTVCNTNGVTINLTTNSPFVADGAEFEKFMDFLKGSIGDKRTIVFSWNHNSMLKDVVSDVMKNANGFEVNGSNIRIPDVFESEAYLSAYPEPDPDDPANYVGEYTDSEGNVRMGTANSNVNSKDSGAKSASSSSDWDKALDEYEKYIDSYVKLMKKVNAGDMSAMTEYATMLEKIGSLAEKLDKAGGNMTTAQASRYLKITTKMADALQ